MAEGVGFESTHFLGELAPFWHQCQIPWVRTPRNWHRWDTLCLTTWQQKRPDFLGFGACCLEGLCDYLSMLGFSANNFSADSQSVILRLR